MVLQYKNSFVRTEVFVGANSNGWCIELVFVGSATIYWGFDSTDDAKYIFEYLMSIIEAKESKRIVIDSVLNDYKNRILY